MEKELIDGTIELLQKLKSGITENEAKFLLTNLSEISAYIRSTLKKLKEIKGGKR